MFLYNYSVYFSALITAPIVVYLVDFPDALVSSVFPAYHVASISAVVYYIPAIGISLLLGITGSYASSLAISVGDLKPFLKYAMATCVIQLVALLILVPFIGAYGVIFGLLLLGSLVCNYLYSGYIRKQMHIHTDYKVLVRMFFACVVLAVIMYPINLLHIRATYQLIIGIIYVLVLYPPLLVVTKALGRTELALLNELSKKVQVFGKLIGVMAAYTSLFVGKSKQGESYEHRR